MRLAKRLVLVTALVGLGLAGCKKDKKEEAKPDKTAKVDTPAGSGSASGSSAGTGVASGSGTAAKAPPPPAAAKAISGFAALVHTENVGKAAGGMAGGFGGALGGLFGGGGEARAAAAEPTKADPPGEAYADDTQPPPSTGDTPSEPPPSDPGLDIEFPPAGAPGGDCAAVTDRLMIIVQRMIEKQLDGMSDAEKQAAAPMVQEQVSGMKDQFLKMCVDQKWSQELRDCALTAMDAKAFQACDKYAPADTGEPTAEPVEPTPTAQPVAEWTGGDECKDVGERMRQLTLAQVGELPDEAKAEVDKALDEQVAEITDACTTGAWSPEWRHCMTHATSMDAVSACFQ